MPQFYYVPDKRARMVRIDNGFYNWLNERTFRDRKELNKMKKLSQEPLFSSFEEGTKFIFNKYMDDSLSSSLTKQYKRVKKEK